MDVCEDVFVLSFLHLKRHRVLSSPSSGGGGGKAWGRGAGKIVCVCACNFFFTVLSQSKGGILSKACDYIRELRQTNQRLQESFKDVEHTQVDNELLRQQVRPQTFTLQTASPLKATLCRFLQCFQFYKYDFVSS